MTVALALLNSHMHLNLSCSPLEMTQCVILIKLTLKHTNHKPRGKTSEDWNINMCLCYTEVALTDVCEKLNDWVKYVFVNDVAATYVVWQTRDRVRKQEHKYLTNSLFDSLININWVLCTLNSQAMLWQLHTQQLSRKKYFSLEYFIRSCSEPLGIIEFRNVDMATYQCCPKYCYYWMNRLHV